MQKWTFELQPTGHWRTSYQASGPVQEHLIKVKISSIEVHATKAM